MGLLTDPSSGHGAFVLKLIKYHKYVSFLLYTLSIVWFLSLAMSRFHNETYFSENALLPGLVHTEFHDPHATERFYAELVDEMKTYDDGLPYPWLLGKMQQIGLEAYTHEFTLQHPLKGPVLNYTGRNVYGIMRAPRAASTEALVLSAPYRPPNSVHESTAASIAYLLAFAEFAQKGKYWSKDIIFLVTEHEQLGMQAWLEAYHGVTCGSEDVLNHGELRGRAGAIQAAVNLEFHQLRLGQLEIKIEGLNGQLPNLDMFNLVVKLCVRENIPHTFKNRGPYNPRDTKDNLKTMLQMVTAQAIGVPTGNHGLFFRFGIQSLTLEGIEKANRQTNHRLTSISSQQRLIESTFRSLNNLLERFHQSFFFYLLMGTDKFASIGLYIPSLCLLVACCFIKAYIKWCTLNKNAITENLTDEEIDKLVGFRDTVIGTGIEQPKRSEKELKKLYEEEASTKYDFHDREFHFGALFFAFLQLHLFGAALKFSPKLFVSLGAKYGYSMENSVYYGFLLVNLLCLAFPMLLPKMNIRTVALLNVFACLEIGTVFLCIGMCNNSLALLVAAVSVPFILLAYPSKSLFKNLFQTVSFLFIHPLTLIHIVSFLFTAINFPNEDVMSLLVRGIAATKNSMVFTIIDSEIYGNWLFGIVCLLFLPIWLCFWTSIKWRVAENKQNAEKKPSKIPVSTSKDSAVKKKPAANVSGKSKRRNKKKKAE